MLKKHPRALAFIFFTEMWERVGFYTLMAILVLYMDKVLGWSDARKGDFYGLFLALCYFVPLLGGWLGDKVVGQIRTVRAGAFLMALGYVGLAVSGPGRVVPFYLGLLLIGVGTGIFKVNMAVLVGNLYAGKPELKDAGYNIFYMGVNLGAMVAPLVATVNNAVFHSYNLSFWVAAAGMVFALIIWRAGEPHLRPMDGKLGTGGAAAPKPAAGADGPAAVNPAVDRREERQRIATLIILFLIVIFFWVAFYQNFFGLTLFAERSTVVLKWLRPETYQFFEPFYILALTPVLLALFGRLQPRRQGALDAGQDPARHAHHEPGHDRHGLRLARRREPGPEHHVPGLAHRHVFHHHPGRDPHLAHGPVVRLQGRPAQDRRADDGRLVRGHGRRQLRQRPAGQILQPSRPPRVLPAPDGADAPGRGPGRALPQEAQSFRHMIPGGHP